MINVIKEYFCKRFQKDSFCAFVKVFGCQQNEADAEKIKGFLKSVGFSFVNDPMVADFILFVTCAVRHTAENRVFGQIGYLKNIKKMNPTVFICVCGCMVERNEVNIQLKKKFPYIDLICGAKSLDKFPNTLYEKLTSKKIDSFCEMPVLRENKFHAWIPIISGCNNFCSYCIVPFVRGPETSRDYNMIINDCVKYINSGVKILTLLGQNVNSYDFNGIKFMDLIKMIDKLDGNFIFRFMTSHPKDFDKELVDILSQCRHFSGNIHLPVQSGNNRILKLMNRKYNIEDYVEKINYAKSKINNLVLTSDIIVGFPGETDLEFNDTLNLIKKVKFNYIFTFIYSPRKGTAAYLMNDNISYDVKSSRIANLIKSQEKISEELLSNLVGKNFRVIIESVSNNCSLARTKSNLLVKLESLVLTIGEIFEVRIISSNRNCLIGEILKGE